MKVYYNYYIYLNNTHMNVIGYFKMLHMRKKISINY